MDDIYPPVLLEEFDFPSIRALPYNQTTENLINFIVEEQDRDIPQEKEYLGYVALLLKDKSKYSVFSKIFPENTCVNDIYLTDDYHITNYRFVECVRSSMNNRAILFHHKNHANALFFDPVNKIINRYDPQIGKDNVSQRIIDDVLLRTFQEHLPEYNYIGNTLIEDQCVQNVRGQRRLYKGDYYCQDYSLLYMIRRFYGMSHEEAALNLVALGDDVKKEITDILRLMAYSDSK